MKCNGRAENVLIGFAAIGFSNKTGSEKIEDYAGMIRRNPVATSMMTIFMLSLVGLPPTAGFLGKYWLFAAAIKGEFYWLVTVAVLTSVVSLFYYINVVRVMWFHKSDDESVIRFGPSLGMGITLSGIMVIVICILPNSFYKWAAEAARVFFPQF